MAYLNRGMCWLHSKNWQEAKSDLTVARDMGRDIIEAFRKTYRSVQAFEQEN